MERSDDKNRYGRLIHVMEEADRWFYVLIGLAFVYLAGATFFHAWMTFWNAAVARPTEAIMVLINEMLLILIILELLGTIIHYLKVRAIRLEQFFYIGMIACIRRILAAGSHHSFSGAVDEGPFRQYLLDIGINSVVIVLLAVSLFFFTQQRREGGVQGLASPPHPEKPLASAR